MTAPSPRRVVRGTASNYLAKGVTLATWFFLTPFIVGRLGAADYGLWTLIGSIGAYAYLMDFGITAAVTKYVAEHAARNEHDQARMVAGTALLAYALASCVLMLVSVLVAPLVPTWFHIPEADHAKTAWLVLLTGANIALSLPCATAFAVLRGVHRFDLVAAITSGAMLASAAGAVVALQLNGGVVALMASSIPVTLGSQIVAQIAIRRVAPELAFGFRHARVNRLRSIVGYSSSMFLTNASAQIETQTDEIVIGAFLPVANIAPYAVARKISQVPQMLADQFLRVLLPVASQLSATGDRQSLAWLCLDATRLTWAILLPVGLVCVVFAPNILGAWLGDAFASAAPILIVLTVSSLIATASWPASIILQGMARHRPLALAAVGSALVNLVVSIVLVRELGTIGAALGTLIPTAAFSIFTVPYALRLLSVRWLAMLQNVVVPSVLPLVPMLVALLLIGKLSPPVSLQALALVGAAGASLYAATYVLLNWTRPEVRALLSAGNSIGTECRTWLTNVSKI